jgi:hypothetical protein
LRKKDTGTKTKNSQTYRDKNDISAFNLTHHHVTQYK